jgi:hypothetical protein
VVYIQKETDHQKYSHELDMTPDGLDLVMNTGMPNTNLQIKSPYCKFQQSQDKDLPGTSAGARKREQFADRKERGDETLAQMPPKT